MSFRVALIVLSDRAASGERADECIPIMKQRLGEVYSVVRERVLADDPAALQAEIIELADARAADLVLTSGGTGLSPRDRTPQATAAVAGFVRLQVALVVLVELEFAGGGHFDALFDALVGLHFWHDGAS